MPKLLKLVSLESLDVQEGSSLYAYDRLRFVVALDGHPVKWIGWNQFKSDAVDGYGRPLGRIKIFDDGDNTTDDEMAGSVGPFYYWSFADVTVYEADPEGPNFGFDWDTDEWIQNVRLDHTDKTVVEIGRAAQPAHLLPGRSDCHYRLTFSIEDVEVKPDNRLRKRLDGSARYASRLIGDGETNGDLETDKGDCKWICAIDGGGLRGIFPLRVLEQVEDYYGKSCFEIFDMFAGTSTGSMIAGALAAGYSLAEVIALYSDPAIRTSIFAPNEAGQRHAFRYLDLKRLQGTPEETLDNALSPAWLSDLVESHTGDFNRMLTAVGRQLMTPRYRKVGMKEVLYRLLSEQQGQTLRPLRLGELEKDILITARDLHRNETTVFAAFHHEVRVPVGGLATAVARRIDDVQGAAVPTEVADFVTGRFQDLFVKDVVEASSSAPVYFAPRAGFSDGGIGPYNNPSFIAAFHALNKSNIDHSEQKRQLTPRYLPYSEGNGTRSGTVVWSFGTGHMTNSEKDADAARLVGGSLSLNKRTDTVLYWAEQVLENLMSGSSQEQVFLCREVLADQIKFLRLDVGFDLATMGELRVDGDYREALSAIKLDAYLPSQFSLMNQVAEKFALRARNERFGFDATGYELPDPEMNDGEFDTYVSLVEREFETYE